MRVIAAATILFIASLASAADRGRAVRLPAHSGIVVGQEYRIPATPDSPWLESIAVAVGPSSGVVLWTEQSAVRIARIARDGHPLDNTGRLLAATGHPQQHVAIDAYGDHFLAAWCETVAGKQQIDVVLIDGDGHSATPALVVAENITAAQPLVGVTCMDAGCLVSWSGNTGDSQVSIGTVNAEFVSATSSAAASPMLLAPKGIGMGIGTDNLNFAMAYAEPAAYGQSGAFVAKFISPGGSTSETDLLSSSDREIGSTWMAWDGKQWFVLMLDLTTTGELAQEFSFIRTDASGHLIGNAKSLVLDAVGVPPLCPWSPDVFLYDPQNRRVVWDGRNFLVLIQHAIVRVGQSGTIGDRVGNDDYFPRGYALSVSTVRNGRTIVAYSRDTAVALRAIDDMP